MTSAIQQKHKTKTSSNYSIPTDDMVVPEDMSNPKTTIIICHEIYNNKSRNAWTHSRPVTRERICARGEEGNLGSRRNTHGVGSGSESGFGTASHHHL